MTSRAGCASRPAPLVSVALALALALAPGASLAQVGATQQQALAEALFEEGKRLMVAERYDEACPRLAESQQAEPAGGTVLLLAVCLERQGKLASAWASFSEALVVARRDRNAQRTSVARQHLAALSPRLTRLVVRVSTELSTLPGLVVLRDGVPLPAASWDTALPVDAGAHVIEARSPGQEPVRVEVEARGEGAVVTVLLSPPAAGASLLHLLHLLHSCLPGPLRRPRPCCLGQRAQALFRKPGGLPPRCPGGPGTLWRGWAWCRSSWAPQRRFMRPR
jgi:tetratricopeptide (TPR) repeat protein